MKLKVQLFVLLLFLFSQSVFTQTFGDGYYRLTTQWLGNVKSLDVINDGTNSKLQLANTGNASGQFWKITSLGNGYYRLTTQWLGEIKSLDVINDGTNNKLQLATTSNASGQYWKITPIGNGYYRLTTKWIGETKSLDVINDGQNNKVQLADSGDFLGQYWKITDISSNNSRNITPVIETSPKFKNLYLSGFKINISEKLAETDDAKEALTILSAKLDEISKILKPAQLEKLKKVPIWIQYKLISDRAMWYHPNKNWLIANGYPAELEKSVEINNVRNFIDWQGDQPFMVLHELAHAFEDLYLREMENKIVEAYNNAVSSGKYDSVPYIRGGKQKAYAMNNKTEYFAELTEAYFGKNDYYPFNKTDLKEFDPEGYKLMQSAWE
jgi:hypothetical protein